MGKKRPFRFALPMVLLLFAARAPLCQANLIPVSLDTTLLIGHPAQPFYVEFQLNDGSGTNDGNNTATINNFDFGGGGPGLTISHTGGALGSMDTGVTITDSDFFNQFFQEFSPGNTLSFTVNLTTAIDLGPQPDQFSFAILDCSQTEIPTKSPANALLSVNIDARFAVQTFAGDPGGVLGCNGGPGIALPAPIVPEPRTVWLLGIGFAAILFLRARLKKKVGQAFSPALFL